MCITSLRILFDFFSRLHQRAFNILGEKMKNYLININRFEKFDYNFINDKTIRIKTWLGYVNYNLENDNFIFFQLGKLKGKGFDKFISILRKKSN